MTPKSPEGIPTNALLLTLCGATCGVICGATCLHISGESVKVYAPQYSLVNVVSLGFHLAAWTKQISEHEHHLNIIWTIAFAAKLEHGKA